MRLSVMFPLLVAVAPAGGTDLGGMLAPVIFAPGVISDGNSLSPAFTPAGDTVYFMRLAGDGSTLMESRRVGGKWSAPRPAPFSGKWRDMDPAMAPDGSFLLFVSNRPATTGGAPLDSVFGGKRYVGKGGNIWRVDRERAGWSAPVRLPDAINACPMTFAPNVAADGSIYYIGCAAADGAVVLLRAVYRDGHYQTPYKVALGGAGAQIRDPAIAPDRAFIVVSIRYEAQAPYRLAISFHSEGGWTAPLDLGDAVNGGTHNMGAQLGCDRRTLYYYNDRPTGPAAPAKDAPDNIWAVSLAPWLRAHGKGSLRSSPRCNAA